MKILRMFCHKTSQVILLSVLTLTAMINFLFILNNDSRYYLQQQQLQLPPQQGEWRAEAPDSLPNSPSIEVTHTTPLNTANNNISISNYQVSSSPSPPPSSSMPSPTMSPLSTLLTSSESRTNDQSDNLSASAVSVNSKSSSPSSTSSIVSSTTNNIVAGPLVSSTSSSTTVALNNNNNNNNGAIVSGGGGGSFLKVNPSETASAISNFNGQVEMARSLSDAQAPSAIPPTLAPFSPPAMAVNLVDQVNPMPSQQQQQQQKPQQQQMPLAPNGNGNHLPIGAGERPPPRKITFTREDLEETKRFAINKVNFCDEDNGATNDLLVVVTSSVTHFDAREAIRKTWGQFATERGSLLLFLLGSPDPSSPNANAIQERVYQEESIHGDLLQGAFVDNYYNLTLKTLSMLRWVNKTCDRVKYILKIDDDMFVNMQMVVDFAETRTFNKAIIGKLARRWKPHREKFSKWYVPTSAFNGSVYPNFATGPAYMITGDAVRPLLESALSGTPIYLEDVYVTGIAAERAGVRRLNHALMKNVKLKVDACSFRRFITSHMHSPAEIIRLWDLVYDAFEFKKCTAAIASTAAKAAAERKNAAGKTVSSTTRQPPTKI